MAGRPTTWGGWLSCGQYNRLLECASSSGSRHLFVSNYPAPAPARLQTPPGTAPGSLCAVVRVIRAAPAARDYSDLRVAVAGGVDSGKSTLVGVLSQGARGAPLLDNGRGSSRMAVFRHKHEIETGHTSSISLQTLAYDADGEGGAPGWLGWLRRGAGFAGYLRWEVAGMGRLLALVQAPLALLARQVHALAMLMPCKLSDAFPTCVRPTAGPPLQAAC